MSGLAVIKDSLKNRGAGFTKEERNSLGVRGLVPPRVFTLQEQVSRFRVQFDAIKIPLEKYKYLMDLQVMNFCLDVSPVA
jgi:hypothetical protein